MKEYKKICRLCGKEFTAKSKFAKVCKDVHTSVCVICGKEFVLKPPYRTKTCSRKCGQQIGNISRKESNLKKYGVEYTLQVPEIRERIKNTTIEKYGVDNVFQSEQVKKKIKETNLEKYGVENPTNCKEIRDKQISTMLARYGVGYATQSDYLYGKIKHTNIIKYGVDNPLGNEDIRNKILADRKERTGYSYVSQVPEIKEKIRNTCLNRYGVPYNCMTEQCRESYRTISKVNLRFADALQENDINYDMEFSLGNFSYDFRVGDVLIEVNPTITHNSEISIFKDSNPVDKNYHLEKTMYAKQHGYRCINVWDWDNIDRIIELVKKPTTIIYARNCEIRKISKSEAVEFTSMYHINGSCNGQNVGYGLYYLGDLVQVMTFGKPRYNRNYDFELLRLCTKFGHRVIGGASKLFSLFKQCHKYESVISYCDASKFLGAVYEKIGMEFISATKPNKIWSKPNSYEHITNNLLNQRGYDQLFKTNYGKGTSNEQLMLENGWLPVYDCGQLVYEFSVNRYI